MTTRLILILIFLSASSGFSFGQVVDTAAKNRNQNSKANFPVVYVKFCVATTGEVSNVFVSKIKCKGCSNRLKEEYSLEAKKIVSSMPAWPPAKENTYFTVPIKFDTTD
jgi:hypothetical protein